MQEFFLVLGGIVLFPFALMTLISLIVLLPVIVIYALELVVWLIAFIVAVFAKLCPLWIVLGFMFFLLSIK